jgi:hypothetical protein
MLTARKLYQAGGANAQALALPAHDQANGGQALRIELVALQIFMR